MRFYVASKFENQDEVRAAIALLTEAGHTVTRDWTQAESWDWDEPGATERLAPIVSQEDLNAVRRADFVVVISYNYRTMLGAHVELGAALALGKQVFMMGEQPRNIFAYHPDVIHVPSVEEVARFYELVAELELIGESE